MTAFLFIPAAAGTHMTRRVDLSTFASLFAEVEEPVAAPARGAVVARMLAMLLVLVLAIGDTVLIARPDALHASGSPVADVAVPAKSL